MQLKNKVFGSRGETIAKNYLLKNGFSILKTNYRTRYGEIDIIARRDRKILFVEVKSRSSTVKGKPYEAVGTAKVQHMRLAAQLFIQRYSLHQYLHTLAVISIIMPSSDHEPHIQFFENIVY